MDVLSLTSDVAARYAIPESCRESLYAAFLRVVSDGKEALNSDETAPAHVMEELDACVGCVSEDAKNVGVVDGDTWESVVNQRKPGKSIDIGLFVKSEDIVSVLPIEGKLGIVCECQGDRGGKSIHLSAIEAKVEGFRALVSNRVQLCSDTLILVPRNGQEWAWYLIRKWNLAGTRIGRLFACCLSDFLSLIGISSSNRPKECKTTMNVFRRERLIAEFEHPGPMSQVQLPSAGICIGCRKCREACPRKAIAVIPDGQERLYPFVDKVSCKSGCRYCESVCPILTINSTHTSNT